jgi:hypothetical protein
MGEGRVDSGTTPGQEFVKNPRENRGFHGLQRLTATAVMVASSYGSITCDPGALVLGMCKLGKLNYVAGAEIPKRYLPGPS